MGRAVALRPDFCGDDLRRLAKQHKDGACTRRLLALSLIYDGESRSAAARFGGVGLQIVRDWVLRFNAHGVNGLVNGKAPGRKPLLNDEQRVALAALVDSGPQFEVDGTVRWRLCDLIRWISVEFGIKASRQTVARELRMMGYRKLSARPRHHAQDSEAIAIFKKTSLPHWQKSVNVRPEAKK